LEVARARNDFRAVAQEAQRNSGHAFDVNIHSYFRVTKAALPHLGAGASVNTGEVLSALGGEIAAG
jgi:NAD(P)-dependent dehydrogenase (short-subunit alcohol dehydrogenase family)